VVLRPLGNIVGSRQGVPPAFSSLALIEIPIVAEETDYGESLETLELHQEALVQHLLKGRWTLWDETDGWLRVQSWRCSVKAGFSYKKRCLDAEQPIQIGASVLQGGLSRDVSGKNLNCETAFIAFAPGHEAAPATGSTVIPNRSLNGLPINCP
jgi:hypothetical protein